MPPRVTGMPAAKEIVESQASASNTIRKSAAGAHREMLIDRDCDGRRRIIDARITVVIADCKLLTSTEIKA